MQVPSIVVLVLCSISGERRTTFKFTKLKLAMAEDNYEPDYELESILIGDSISLEVLSVVGKSENRTDLSSLAKIVEQN